MKSIKNKIKPKPKRHAAEKVDSVQRLVELLRINQIELEHQNQELRITQEELELSRNKYVSLFDFAPVPYFTLNIEGIIKEVNLIASKMLKIDRNKIAGKNFISFVSGNNRDVFKKFLNDVFNSDKKISCELNIVNKEKQLSKIRLEGIKLKESLDPNPKCQVAVIEL
jgi:PAS domain-containing protein